MDSLVPGLTVTQVRAALDVLRCRHRDGTLTITDELMYGMTVQEFCTTLSINKNIKGLLKRRRFRLKEQTKNEQAGQHPDERPGQSDG